ncbi:M6 family metalloprotease domain-containing protein [Streptomyces lavendulocolor]|uniref:M6 family metalloprotease domain-containing protein n=1 Tax=Streptomyces lavendulocolor TaxID=67316 RepID=UPI003404D3FB
MIFVDFPDAPATDTPGDLYEALVPGAADFYRSSSYRKLRLSVNADTSRFYRMPASSDSYGYRRGLSSSAHERYIQDALRAVGHSVDFSGSHLLYIVPTSAAKDISFSPTFMGPVQAADGAVLARTVTFGQDMTRWGPKVVIHETGHALGMPDLYSFSGGASHAFVGGWDVMGLISGHSPDHLAWHKWQLEWLTNTQVDCVTRPGTTTHTITPVENAGGTKMTVIKTGRNRAVVVEVRSRNGLNYQSCSTGVLIYTVDTATPSGSGPVRVSDSRRNTGCGGYTQNDGVYTTAPGVNTYSDDASDTTIRVISENAGTGAYTITVLKER